MEPKMGRRFLLFVSFFVVGLLFVACQPADATVSEADQPAIDTVTEQPQADVDDEVEQVPTETEAVEQEEQPAVTEAGAEVVEVESDEQVAPTARIGLVATNPQDIKLASGEIQLVEFFAFW